MSDFDADDATTATDRVTLSTGHAVTLPLETAATAAGVVLTADADRVREPLPDRLAPVRTWPGRSPVVLVGVRYHRIGDDAVEPYDEFGILLPAVRSGDGALEPISGLLAGDIGAYVWLLPVTTEPGRALGVEIWDYPKRVLDVDIVERAGRRRTTVSENGERIVSFAVRRPPTIDATVRVHSFAGERPVRRIPHVLDGRLGAWPLTADVDVSLGEHRWADRLRSLDVDTGDRALARVWLDGRFVVERGDSI